MAGRCRAVSNRANDTTHENSTSARLDTKLLADLLERTSRTFAVAIPLLDQPSRRQVGLAYLLLRIADNFEDATPWTKAERIEALMRFDSALAEGPVLNRDEVEDWVARRPQADQGYMDLLQRAPIVVQASRDLGSAPWEIISRHVRRSIAGMIDTVRRTDRVGALELESMEDLERYCYLVAGIVGELLTELFVLEAPTLEPVRRELESRAATFGEALQLVNIVKDASADAIEGRRFLPEEVSVQEVLARARRDLIVAQEYVEWMRRDGTPHGMLAFTALPVRLAWATLEVVERRGAGAKVSRLAVANHVRAVRSALEKGRPLFPTVDLAR